MPGPSFGLCSSPRVGRWVLLGDGPSSLLPHTANTPIFLISHLVPARGNPSMNQRFLWHGALAGMTRECATPAAPGLGTCPKRVIPAGCKLSTFVGLSCARRKVFVPQAMPHQPGFYLLGHARSSEHLRAEPGCAQPLHETFGYLDVTDTAPAVASVT